MHRGEHPADVEGLAERSTQQAWRDAGSMGGVARTGPFVCAAGSVRPSASAVVIGIVLAVIVL